MTVSPRTRECKYGCKTLLAWDDDEAVNAYVEVENNFKPHTRERCESLKPREKKENGNNHAEPHGNALGRVALVRLDPEQFTELLEQLRKGFRGEL